jgi:PAS domain S-box-containing protein/diguanylate cyclase (GGDEF)-like protein
VHQGRLAEAQQLLASVDLANQRSLYLQGLSEFSDIEMVAHDALEARRNESRQADAVLTLVSLILLVLGSALGFRTARKWRVMVLEKNRQLNETAADLAEFNRQLDQTVSERTRELTERTVKLAELGKKLESSEAQYRLLFDNNPHPMWVYDLDSLRFLAVNASAVQHYGYSIAEFMTMTIRDIRPAEDVPALESDVAAKRGEGKDIGMWRHRIKDGTTIDVEISSDRLQFNGVPARLILAHDVTARNQAEIRLKRLNRVYMVLSQINMLIVRAQSRDELFKGACRIAVEAGQFVAAAISLIDTATGTIEPAAAHWTGRSQPAPLPPDAFRAQSPENKALHVALFDKHQPIVCNDLELAEPDQRFGSQVSVPGVRALITLPLVLAGQTVGLFELFSGEANVFDEAELKLLLELAGDIAFALSALNKTEQLDYLSYFDPLTGLPNSRLFGERVAQMLTQVSEQKPDVAIVHIEVDDLARINQSLGKEVGESLVRMLAGRFNDAFGSLGAVARLGENIFGVAVPRLWDALAVARAEELFLAPVFSAPFVCAEQELRLSGKAGMAFYPADGNDPEALQTSAEAALREAKASDEPILCYAAPMRSRVAETLSLESRLRRAMEREEFVLHYQPKLSTTSRQIVGVEALMRWNEPDNGLVAPFKFIPILEETGLIVEVGAWALRRAASDHASWLEQGLNAPRIAVNVSAVQLRKRDFVDVVEQSLSHNGQRGGIDIEITESSVMRDIEASVRKLNDIRSLGLGIAMDDFGTGFSSLASLAKLPVTEVKIDRSFVITMMTEPTAMSLVSTIITMAHSLGLKVVAEGVEEEDQAKYLRLLRCDELQGYLFSKPVPLEAVTRLIQNGL